MWSWFTGLPEMIDWTINFGNVLTIVMIVGGWAWTILQMRNDGFVLKKEVEELKADVKKFGAIVTDNAVINKRLDYLEEDVREMKHGKGFVKGPRGIDREFP